ncbi:hypothetical protein Scep_012002 [Stephania cephalantha]|uniref:Uncharacterized protein n=1 Tax=Stephania cephalantha TaxID=152367 RepID=A0AAP0P724_9MAGN
MDECEMSPTEPNIIIAQDEKEENEMKIEVILKRLEESQKQSNEYQHLVLEKPSTLPCILIELYKVVDVKERSQIFYIANTFVLDDHDAIEVFVLEGMVDSVALEPKETPLNLESGVKTRNEELARILESVMVIKRKKKSKF